MLAQYIIVSYTQHIPDSTILGHTVVHKLNDRVVTVVAEDSCCCYLAAYRELTMTERENTNWHISLLSQVVMWLNGSENMNILQDK